MTTTEPTTALVTGANKGMGFETVRTLANQGWRVFLAARNAERGQAAVDSLTADGLNVEFIQLDVGSDDSAKAAAEHLASRIDHLDVLINNAGIGGSYNAPDETSTSDFEDVYNTNIFGPVRVTNALLPLLRRSENARVVMVSSSMGSIGRVTDPTRFESEYHDIVYSSSKAALNMLTVQYAATEPRVKFNLANPGLTATEFSGPDAPQSVSEGAEAIITLANIGADGPTATFIDRHGNVPW